MFQSQRHVFFWELYPLYQLLVRDVLAHCSGTSPICSCTCDDGSVGGIPVCLQFLNLRLAWQYSPVMSLAYIKVQEIPLGI